MPARIATRHYRGFRFRARLPQIIFIAIVLLVRCLSPSPMVTLPVSADFFFVFRSTLRLFCCYISLLIRFHMCSCLIVFLVRLLLGSLSFSCFNSHFLPNWMPNIASEFGIPKTVAVRVRKQIYTNCMN